MPAASHPDTSRTARKKNDTWRKFDVFVSSSF